MYQEQVCTQRFKGARYSPLQHNEGAIADLWCFKALHPQELGGDSESTKYTNIQSDYVENLAKIKILEARIIAYDMIYPFIIPTLVDDYAGSVEYRWGNRVVTGV